MTSGGHPPPTNEVGVLAARLAGGLLLLAGALFGLIAIGISRLQSRGSGDTLRYVLPWADDVGLAPGILIVMIGCSAFVGVAGVAVLAWSPRPAATSVPSSKRRSRRPTLILAAGLIVLAAVIAARIFASR